MVKLVASETAERVVCCAIQALGGYGYLEEFGLAKTTATCGCAKSMEARLKSNV